MYFIQLFFALSVSSGLDYHKSLYRSNIHSYKLRYETLGVLQRSNLILIYSLGDQTCASNLFHSQIKPSSHHSSDTTPK